MAVDKSVSLLRLCIKVTTFICNDLAASKQDI